MLASFAKPMKLVAARLLISSVALARKQPVKPLSYGSELIVESWF